MKKLVMYAGLLSSASLFSTGALAGSTNYWFGNEVTLLSDNSAECLINAADGASNLCSVGPDTFLDLGDRLRGIFTIETTEGQTSGADNILGPASGFDELAGIFDITVTAKAPDGAGGFDYAWGPTPGFEAIYGVGAMIAMYSDPNYEYTRLGNPGTEAALYTNVTNGNLELVFGYTAALPEFWVANAVTDDISFVGGIPSPGNGGSFNLGLNILTNNTGKIFNALPCFDPSALAVITVSACGSGSLLGTGGVNTPFDSFDDVNFTMFKQIPEPGTVSIMGLGLLALARLQRRRKV